MTKKLEQLTPIELAHLAGILEFARWDISQVPRRDRNNEPAWKYNIVFCRSTATDVVSWLSEILGINPYSIGSKTTTKMVKFHNRTRSLNMHAHTINIKLTSDSIRRLVPKIKPYLIFKKEHCILFEQFIDTLQVFRRGEKGNAPLPDDIQNEREIISKRIRELNHSVREHPRKGNK